MNLGSRLEPHTYFGMDYNDLVNHVRHEITVMEYKTDHEDINDYTLECETCGMVLANIAASDNSIE